MSGWVNPPSHTPPQTLIIKCLSASHTCFFSEFFCVISWSASCWRCLEKNRNFLDLLWWAAFLKFSWKIKGSGGFGMPVCVYYCSGKCLGELYCVCSVQWVLRVWGKSPAGSYQQTALWLAQACWSPYILTSCVFSQTNSHCFSVTWALAKSPFQKMWTPSPEKGKEGRK